MTESDAQQRLLEFVGANLAADREGEPVRVDDELLNEGIIDSLGVMELVSFIEDDLGVAVDDEDIIPDNFRSVRALAALVMTKVESPAA